MLKGLSKVFSWIVHDQIIRNWNASFNVIVQNSISLQRFKKTLLLERRRHLDENLSANCTRWSPSTQQHFGEESFIYLNCTQEFDYHVESRWSQVTCTVIQDMHCSCTVHALFWWNKMTWAEQEHLWLFKHNVPIGHNAPNFANDQSVIILYPLVLIKLRRDSTKCWGDVTFCVIQYNLCPQQLSELWGTVIWRHK